MVERRCGRHSHKLRNRAMNYRAKIRASVYIKKGVPYWNLIVLPPKRMNLDADISAF